MAESAGVLVSTYAVCGGSNVLNCGHHSITEFLIGVGLSHQFNMRLETLEPMIKTLSRSHSPFDDQS